EPLFPTNFPEPGAESAAEALSAPYGGHSAPVTARRRRRTPHPGVPRRCGGAGRRATEKARGGCPGPLGGTPHRSSDLSSPREPTAACSPWPSPCPASSGTFSPPYARLILARRRPIGLRSSLGGRPRPSGAASLIRTGSLPRMGASVSSAGGTGNSKYSAFGSRRRPVAVAVSRVERDRLPAVRAAHLGAQAADRVAQLLGRDAPAVGSGLDHRDGLLAADGRLDVLGRRHVDLDVLTVRQALDH